MNGLELIDLKPTGFVANLLGLRPKENAFLEIHNVVATLPIDHISEDAVTACLSRYGITLEEAKTIKYLFASIGAFPQRPVHSGKWPVSIIRTRWPT